MKYDHVTAMTIALKGKHRMQTEVSEGRYTVECDAEGQFLIRKQDGTTYRVTVFVNPEDRRQQFGMCSCAFSNNGEENWTCKHIEFCLDLQEWEQVWKPETIESLRVILSRYYGYGEGTQGRDTGPIEGDSRIAKMFA